MEHSPFWAAAALAEFVRDQASWRRSQAQRFPADARNAQSADALEQLAMHVEALPDTDRHLIELVELDAFDDASHFTVGEETRRAIARWGFGDATSHMRPRDLLQDLVAITRRARRAQTPAQKRNTKVLATHPRTVKWLRDRPGLKAHAVRKELDDGRAVSFCGFYLDPATADDVEAPVGSSEAGCALCSATMFRERVSTTRGDSAGSDHPLHESEVTTLDDIFTIAIAHDTVCQEAEDALYRAVGYRGRAKSGPIDTGVFEDLEGAYRFAMIELCAIVARAAISRLEILAPLNLSEKGSISELNGVALEGFLRPIFEESGIGDRFEVRSGHTIFKRDDD